MLSQTYCMQRIWSWMKPSFTSLFGVTNLYLFHRYGSFSLKFMLLNVSRIYPSRLQLPCMVVGLADSSQWFTAYSRRVCEHSVSHVFSGLFQVFLQPFSPNITPTTIPSPAAKLNHIGLVFHPVRYYNVDCDFWCIEKLNGWIISGIRE